MTVGRQGVASHKRYWSSFSKAVENELNIKQTQSSNSEGLRTTFVFAS